MESIPLQELLLGKLVRFLGIPIEHRIVELDADGAAVLLEDAFGVVEQVVRIDDADIDLAGVRLGTAIVPLTTDLRANLAGGLQIIEQTAQFVVTGFARHERVEPGPVDQRRNAAAIVAGNRRVRVANEKREVELLQELARDDTGVVGFGFRFVVRKRRTLGRAGRRRRRRSAPGAVDVHDDAGILVADAILRLAPGRRHRSRIRADTALDFLKRWSDARRLLFRRHQIMSDVFDEDTLSLEKK